MSITAILSLILRGSVEASFAGLALAYAAQLSGIFQYTVRLSTETEARFTSVQRISNYTKVGKLLLYFIYMFSRQCFSFQGTFVVN